MALLVLDASIVIAWFDRNDALHLRSTAALELTSTDDRVLPASAYAESLVVPNRLGQDAIALFERALAGLPVRIEPITAEVARRAAELRARHQALRLGDALVLATAIAFDAAVLTADRAWTRYYSRARVI